MYFVHPQLNTIKPFFAKFSEGKLKQKLSKFFSNRYIIFTDSGRSAFQLAIKELGLENSEMLVPAYLCDIFIPIFEHYNIKPIYVDIYLKTFNIDISEIEKKITPKTKSILVSHTYGLPNDMDKILEIAKKYNLKIIEDCAHAFGTKFQDKYLGNFGEVAFFSLPKFLPSINGGMLISKNPINPDLPKYKFKINDIIKFSRLFPILAKISEWFRTNKENLNIQKSKTKEIPRDISEGTLSVFNWYLDNFEKQISKRTKLAKYFQGKLEEIGFQTSPGITYVSALVPKNLNRDDLFNKLRKKGIFCSRIWQKPLYPRLPNTAEAASRIINFPLQNWFTEKDIDKIISCI